MTAGFVSVPDAARYRLVDARVPTVLLADGAAGDDLTRADLVIADGRIEAVLAPGTAAADLPASDLRGGQVWPGFVDLHTHLDKGHIWPRAANPDGTFGGALATVEADRAAHWSADDIRARMEFGLACAFAHGTVAIRTHLDCIHAGEARTTWRVFAELRQRWAGRITLQGVSLTLPEDVLGPDGEPLADLVAENGGILGCIAYDCPEVEAAIEALMRRAAARGLDLDFHVDEDNDPNSDCLRLIAEVALKLSFPNRIVVGHCCSLALRPEAEARRTLDRVAEAGLAVVSLPMCNMYLQDRVPGRTPRWRGVTLVHEFAARDIPVAFASDNCRDPFYAYGDHDMVEVWSQAVRIAHLDHPIGAWPAAVTRRPAAAMGLGSAGRIAAGTPADLVLFNARTPNELLARPQGDRVVLRAGRQIATTPPDYRELDALFRGRG